MNFDNHNKNISIIYVSGRKISLLNDRQLYVQRKRIYNPRPVRPFEQQSPTRYSRPGSNYLKEG